MHHSKPRRLLIQTLGLAVAALLLHFFPSPDARAASGPEPADKAWLDEHYNKFELRIPMRDGVRLFTAIYTPKSLETNLPIWMLRTPYGIRPYGSDTMRDAGWALRNYAREQFIFALQDVRGRNGSEGQYTHMRPILPGKPGPTETDESTDTWDTIEWLIHHLPHNSGKVGLSGISYPGFYSAAGAIHSHPALKAVSPQAPIADWFIGDDDHHNGALFLAAVFNFYQNFEQKLDKPTRENPKPFDFETPDGYRFFLNLGSLANVNPRHFKNTIPWWNDLMAHDTYDAFWQSRDLRPHLKEIHAAILTVGGWFDAEDLFGPLQIHHEINRLNPSNPSRIVMGPWAHGQWGGGDGKSLGHVEFKSATAEFFRNQIELPFFNHHLKGSPDPHLPRATVFETGINQWRRFDHWPPTSIIHSNLFLHAEGHLTTSHPDAGDAAFDEFISDPNHPVPYTATIATGQTREFMLEDQRFASTRTDVLTYQTDPLDADLTLAGPIRAKLQVSTTGTDADWIVKVIDVYPGDFPNPNPNPANLQMGGFQQLVRAEIMRGKFRNSFEHPQPFTPGQITPVEWTLPDAFHTFRRGHRLMIQIQSSWFPLTDRNPQVFCNINQARNEDFKKATHRVFRSATAASSLTLPILPQPIPNP